MEKMWQILITFLIWVILLLSIFEIFDSTTFKREEMVKLRLQIQNEVRPTIVAEVWGTAYLYWW